ncbi:MAG: hypothetical protein WAZ19_04535 [Anaerolineae bacterium]
MSTFNVSAASGMRLVSFVILTALLAVLTACGSAPASVAPAPTAVVLPTAAPTTTSLPATVEITTTASITATALVSQTAPITTTAELTTTLLVSETIPLVEAPEIGVDVMKILTEVERVGLEMGLTPVIDSDNSFTMDIPVKDENGKEIILRETVRSITLRLVPDGAGVPQDLSALLEHAGGLSAEDRARSGNLLSRGFKALVEDGYNPAEIRFWGERGKLVETEVYFKVGVEDVDKFAQIWNGKGAASMGFMSRVAGSDMFTVSRKGFFISAGGMWDPAKIGLDLDVFLTTLGAGVSDLTGSDEAKTFEELKKYNPTEIYFTAANRTIEGLRETIDRINKVTYGGAEVFHAEDYLGGN